MLRAPGRGLDDPPVVFRHRSDDPGGPGDVYRPRSDQDTYGVGADDSPLPTLYERLDFPDLDTGLAPIEGSSTPRPPLPPMLPPLDPPPPAPPPRLREAHPRLVRMMFVGAMFALISALGLGLVLARRTADQLYPLPTPGGPSVPTVTPARPTPPPSTPQPTAPATGPTAAARPSAISDGAGSPAAAPASPSPANVFPSGPARGNGAPVQLPPVAAVPQRPSAPAAVVAAAPAPAAGPARAYFTLGSSAAEVIAVQGKPDSASDSQWAYGTAYVVLQGGKVVGWSDVSGKLKVQLEPAAASATGTIGPGTSMDEVASIMGTPNYLSSVQWTYGAAYLTFQGGKVNGWSNVGGKLKVQLPNSGKSATGLFAVGATPDDVAAVQGTPEYLAADRWGYGTSSVDFLGGQVVGWSNHGGNLKVQIAAPTTPTPPPTAGRRPEPLAQGGIADYFMLVAYRTAGQLPASWRPPGPPVGVERATGPAAPYPRAIEVARSQLGRPYVWGGASPRTSFDCSGLVQWSFGQIGRALPRTAQEQYYATVPVDAGDIRPGDLVFYANTYASSDWVTHVGIYLGGGRMINATTEGGSVSESQAFGGALGSHFVGAGRVRA